MATRFQSSTQRSFWLGMLVGLVTDAAIAFLVAWFISGDASDAVVPAAFILAAAYLFQLVYGLISLARGAVLFWIEKSRRVDAIVDQMVATKMPRPDGFYNDPTDYLAQVVNSDEASNEAKLLAGATIGQIETLRLTSRHFLVMSTLMVLEEAIAIYGRRAPGYFSFDEPRHDQPASPK